jgi:signal recognition particle receptor subunit beta
MILQRFKIVFAGGMGAGKTEAIRSLSEIPYCKRRLSIQMHSAIPN